MRLYDSAGRLKIDQGAAGGGITNINLSAGTTSNNLSNFVLSNSNNVSFGLNGSTITGSVTVASTQGSVNFSAGTTSNLLSAVTFSNSNGISFGLDGSTITGSHNALTSQSNQNVTAANGGFAFQTLSFSNLNGMSFGTSAGSAITGSYTVPSTAGLISAVNFSAGSTSSNLGSVVFSNSNRVSFGLNGSTITASISELINFSAGTQASDLRSVVFSDSNGISFGLSNGTITAQHNALTSQSNQAFSAAGGSSAFQTLGFSDNSNVSFTNTNGSVGVASVRASLFAVSNTTQSSSGTQNLNAISFNGAGNVSVGFSNGSVVISGAGGGETRLTAYAQSNTTQSSSGTIALSSINFAGAGIASVGVTNGSVVVSVPAGGGAGDGGVFAGVSNLGNTAGSTGTVSTGAFVLVGSNGISLSQSTGAAGSAATVTIYGPVISDWQPAPIATLAGSTQNNSSMSIFPMRLPCNVSASGILLAASLSGGTAANTSSAGFTISLSVVFYTNNASTLSSFNSASTTYTNNLQSNSTGSIFGMRMFALPLATDSLFSVGNYWIGAHARTTTGGQTSLSKAISFVVMPHHGTVVLPNYINSGTTQTRGFDPGMAAHSTSETRQTIAFSDITGHGPNSASQCNLWYRLVSTKVW